MKNAIVMSFFMVISFSVLAENIDQVEQREKNKIDRKEENISRDINRREAREKKKEEIEVKEQSEKINRAEEEEDEMVAEETPEDERDPGEGVGRDSTKPGKFIPDEMEQDIKKELKNPKCNKCTKDNMCEDCKKKLKKTKE